MSLFLERISGEMRISLIVEEFFSFLTQFF